MTRSEMTTGEADAWHDCRAQIQAYLRDFASGHLGAAHRPGSARARARVASHSPKPALA